MRIAFILSIIWLLSACNTTKAKQDQPLSYANLMIELKEGVSFKTLENDFSNLEFSKNKLSSKSQNLWFATVGHTFATSKELTKELLSNKAVIKCYEPNGMSPPTNSTNVKSAKTKPIKK